MQISPKSTDITKDYTVSGTIANGGYTYVLMVNPGDGESLIKRINSDSSEIKFARKDDDTTIETFWAAYSSQTYVWIHQIVVA